MCSCALLVGDLSGDAGSHPVTDATSPPADAAHPADHAIDSSHRVDAGHDAGPEAGREDARSDRGAAGDATRIDAHDGGHEGGSHDSGGDAEHAHDTGASKEASLGDAGGFCARYPPQPGTWFICDDFDQSSDPTDLGPVNTFGGGGVVMVRSDASASPPNALFVATNPSGGPTAGSGAYVIRALPASDGYAIDFDFKVAPLPAYLNTQLVALEFAGLASVAITLHSGDAGVVNQISIDEVNIGTSGPGYIFHPLYAVPSPSANGWTHVSLRLADVVAPVDTLIVNGVAVEVNFSLGDGFFAGQASAVVGWYYAQSPGLRQAYIDNVVIVAQ